MDHPAPPQHPLDPTNRPAAADVQVDLARPAGPNLNPAQQAAVAAREGSYLLIAGAGSGKTRTLVHRVASLVDQGVPPDTILLLTFTRRAAQEMLRRAAALLDERCQRVAGGTFHAFANQVLRRQATRLGYQDNFTIIDRADGRDMVGILRAEQGYDRRDRRFARAETLLDLFSRKINTQRPLAQLIAEDCPQFSDDLPAIMELEQLYDARKKAHNVMDYDDLLVNLRQLLVQHSDVRQQLAATYHYIMVDEYQDTNRLQAHLAALLAADHGNLMVVGDDAQSIYAFRGADFRNIIDFPKIFPQAKTLLLEQNYRSAPPILALANGIMALAREGVAKQLYSQLPGTARPVFVRTADEQDQAAFVAERILLLREEGVPLNEIAVLARAAWHSSALELELKRRNIPFQKFGGIRFVEAAHVKDLCALLKLGINPLDATAWFRVLQLYPGVGARTAQRLTASILAAGGDHRALLAAGTPPGVAPLTQLLPFLSDERPFSVQLAAAIEHYLTLLPQKYDDAHLRAGDLEALQVIAARYLSAETFLTDLAIEPPEVVRAGSQPDREDEWITVSTVHSAKGLEWHTVFVLELVTGHFPAYQSLRDSASLEEERRLLYVAVTRAKANLYLLKPEELTRRGGHRDLAELSPLLADIPNLYQLVEEQIYCPQPDLSPTAARVWPAADPAQLAAQLQRIEDYFGS